MNVSEFLTTGWLTSKHTFVSTASMVVTVDDVALTMSRAAGNWITDGVVVGDMLTFLGFGDAANNDTFEVTVVTASLITLGNSTTLVTVASDAGVTAFLGEHTVFAGPALLGGIQVITGSAEVTPYDGTTILWAPVIGASLQLYNSIPLKALTSLRIVSPDATDAWVLYKPVP